MANVADAVRVLRQMNFIRVSKDLDDREREELLKPLRAELKVITSQGVLEGIAPPQAQPGASGAPKAR